MSDEVSRARAGRRRAQDEEATASGRDAAEQVDVGALGVEETADLAASMRLLTRAAARDPGLEATLELLVDVAAATIRGADDAAITLSRGGSLVTAAATSELPRRVDELQYRSGEGPCVTAAIEHDEPCVSPDVRNDDRWPTFGPEAARLGVRSMMAVWLPYARGETGALNLYSSRPSAFSPTAALQGVLFATHASLALSKAAEHEAVGQLEVALERSRLVGTAVGILMARAHIGRDEAFDVLRRTSQRLNRQVYDIADVVVQQGDLPDR